MSLDIWAKRKIENKEEILKLVPESLKSKVESVLNEEVFEMNITHNLNKMAEEAGFYLELWHLDNIRTCGDLLPFIEAGLGDLKDKPNKYRPLSNKNNWGTYEQFIPWLEMLVENLKIDLNANLYVSR